MFAPRRWGPLLISHRSILSKATGVADPGREGVGDSSSPTSVAGSPLPQSARSAIKRTRLAAAASERSRGVLIPSGGDRPAEMSITAGSWLTGGTGAGGGAPPHQ